MILRHLGVATGAAVKNVIAVVNVVMVASLRGISFKALFGASKNLLLGTPAYSLSGIWLRREDVEEILMLASALDAMASARTLSPPLELRF